MLKEKLLLLLSVVSLSGFFYSNFKIQKLNKQNSAILAKEYSDIIDFDTLDFDNKNRCVLLCFLEDSKELAGYLVANYVEDVAKIEDIYCFNIELEQQIAKALILDFEKRCKILKRYKIYAYHYTNETVLKNTYMELGYKKLPVIKRAFKSVLQVIGTIVVIDGPAKGAFKSKSVLYKDL